MIEVNDAVDYLLDQTERFVHETFDTHTIECRCCGFHLQIPLMVSERDRDVLKLMTDAISKYCSENGINDLVMEDMMSQIRQGLIKEKTTGLKVVDGDGPSPLKNR